MFCHPIGWRFAKSGGIRWVWSAETPGFRGSGGIGEGKVVVILRFCFLGGCASVIAEFRRNNWAREGVDVTG